jgi:hypothetical protein
VSAAYCRAPWQHFGQQRQWGALPIAIYKRIGKDGKAVRWQTIVEVDDGTGKRRRTVGTYPTKKLAQAAEREALTKRDHGTLVDRSTATIGEVLDQWLTIEAPRVVAPENLPAYEQIIRLHLKPVIGNVRVQKLTNQQIETLLADMRAAGKSASLITKTLQRLKSALKLAQRWGASRPLRLEEFQNHATGPRVRIRGHIKRRWFRREPASRVARSAGLARTAGAAT